MNAIVRYNQDPLRLPSVFNRDPFFKTLLSGIHPEIFEAMDSFDHTGGVNIYEEKDKLYAEVAVPGWKKQDIQVAIEEEKMLKIEGKREKATESDDRKHYHRGMSSTEFSRVLQLPYPVDPKKVKAKYEDGILRIEMQKQESLLSKIIPIE